MSCSEKASDSSAVRRHSQRAWTIRRVSKVARSMWLRSAMAVAARHALSAASMLAIFAWRVVFRILIPRRPARRLSSRFAASQCWKRSTMDTNNKESRAAPLRVQWRTRQSSRGKRKCDGVYTSYWRRSCSSTRRKLYARPPSSRIRYFIAVLRFIRCARSRIESPICGA